MSMMDDVPAVDLLERFHPENWRGHSREQVEVMEAVLRRVGWVSPVIVSKRSGRVIDGEMRVSIAAAAGESVSVIYVDLDIEEERVALATFDAIGEMALTDERRLDQALKGYSGEVGSGVLVKNDGDQISKMVGAVAGGDLISRLWMSVEDDEDVGVDAEDYLCYWVRADSGVDDRDVVTALGELCREYDGVRVEGRGFENLG